MQESISCPLEWFVLTLNLLLNWKLILYLTRLSAYCVIPWWVVDNMEGPDLNPQSVS